MALLKGTLDVLVLKTLSWGSTHCCEISANALARTGCDWQGRADRHGAASRGRGE